MKKVVSLLEVSVIVGVFFFLRTVLKNPSLADWQQSLFRAALLIAAAIFGLMHPLTALGETTPWAWALWTTTVGLILGFLREKTGAVVTPVIVHGVILLPGVLFGAVGK